MERIHFSPHQPAQYRLCLQGIISASWTDWLTNVSVRMEDGQTIITGTVRDQSALFGLISFVRDLGAPFLSIEFISQHEEKENPVNKNVVSLVLKAIALAMGVAVIVLNTLGTLVLDSAVSLLGIGLAALAIAALRE